MTDQHQMEEEDDWETADLTPIIQKGKSGGSLRPTAPTFSPKPPQPQASGSGSRGKEQRIHAPPGGVWNVDHRGMRGDWERRAAEEKDGEGDEWFRSAGRGQSNRQLWDEANSIPTPQQIQLQTPTPLPQPQIKILRRQAPSTSNPGDDSGKPMAQKTYAEKEEEYRLARERIFGSTPAGGGSNGTSPQPQPPSRTGSGSGSRIYTPDTGIVRQPRGPADGGGFAAGPYSTNTVTSTGTSLYDSGNGNGNVNGNFSTGTRGNDDASGGRGGGMGQFPPGW